MFISSILSYKHPTISSECDWISVSWYHLFLITQHKVKDWAWLFFSFFFSLFGWFKKVVESNNVFPEEFFFDTNSWDDLEGFPTAYIDGEVVEDNVHDSNSNVLSGYYHI